MDGGFPCVPQHSEKRVGRLVSASFFIAMSVFWLGFFYVSLVLLLVTGRTAAWGAIIPGIAMLTVAFPAIALLASGPWRQKWITVYEDRVQISKGLRRVVIRYVDLTTIRRLPAGEMELTTQGKPFVLSEADLGECYEVLWDKLNGLERPSP